MQNFSAGVIQAEKYEGSTVTLGTDAMTTSSVLPVTISGVATAALASVFVPNYSGTDLPLELPPLQFHSHADAVVMLNTALEMSQQQQQQQRQLDEVAAWAADPAFAYYMNANQPLAAGAHHNDNNNGAAAWDEHEASDSVYQDMLFVADGIRAGGGDVADIESDDLMEVADDILFGDLAAEQQQLRAVNEDSAQSTRCPNAMLANMAQSGNSSDVPNLIARPSDSVNNSSGDSQAAATLAAAPTDFRAMGIAPPQSNTQALATKPRRADVPEPAVQAPAPITVGHPAEDPLHPLFQQVQLQQLQRDLHQHLSAVPYHQLLTSEHLGQLMTELHGRWEVRLQGVLSRHASQLDEQQQRINAQLQGMRQQHELAMLAAEQEWQQYVQRQQAVLREMRVQQLALSHMQELQDLRAQQQMQAQKHMQAQKLSE